VDALPDGAADGVLADPVEGVAPPAALEDDESLDDGVADDVPVELAGGVAALELEDGALLAAGGVAVDDEEDDGGVALLLALLPSSLPHAVSASATAAAKSQEFLFMGYPFVDKS
jgi:hypothetical protein